MSLERQILIWALVIAALFGALYVLGSAVTPFATGIALGYLLDPVVIRLERLGMNRLAASLLILAIFVLVLVVGLVVVAPVLANQLIGFTQKLPGYVMRLQALAVEEGSTLADKYGGTWLDSLGLRNSLSADQIQKSIGDFVSQGAQWLMNAVRSIASGGAALAGFFSLLVVTPVVAFYILVDWNKMIAALDSWLPLDHRANLRVIATEINNALAGFIRGQSLVCLFLGLWYGLGLTVIDALALRTDVRIRAGEGTQVTMWFEIADPGGRFEAPPDPAPRPFTVPDGDVAVAISPAPLGTAILGRLVGALAARAGFSIDRLSDAQLVTDSLAAHVGAALDGPYVNAAIAVLEGRAVALELDGLRDGGAAALLAGSAIASLGPVIERLADEIEVRAGARGETLRLVLRDPWRSF